MYVIGTAGHVDHGKSALVQALTGVDPDRWAEEKERGLTIDLGFAELELPSGRTASIVDVPGHARFVKNMLAGAGGIDAALLVIAADDGVMPQTREHLAILDLLGIDRGVAVISKADLVSPERVAAVIEEASDILDGTVLAGAAFIPCSTVTGEGLGELVSAVDSVLATTEPKQDRGRPRLPVDRAFSMPGFGTVVTGTLIDGTFRVGETVELLPAGGTARIRGIQHHNRDVGEARPGNRTALNLSGISADELERGTVIASPGCYIPATSLDVKLTAVSYLGRPLRHNRTVSLHLGAAEVPARIILLESGEITPGGSGWAQLRLARQIVAAAGDRFVVRDSSGTVGGGTVLGLDPPRRRRNDPAAAAALEAVYAGSPEDRVLALIAANEGLALSSFTEADQGAVRGLMDAGLVRIVDGDQLRVVTTAFYEDAQDRVSSALEEYHREHPLRAGMPRGELLQALGLETGVAEAILVDASRSGMVHAGDRVSLSSFQPALTPAQEAAAQAFVAQLAAAPFSPPTDGAVEPDLLRYLVASGRVVDAGGVVVFEAGAFGRTVDLVAGHIEQNGSVTLAEVRDLLSTTRKYAQPLLEEMDRRRITRRVGEGRVLYRQPASPSRASG